jgi:anti-sigma factor RsiW
MTDFSEQLSAYLDGELSDEQAAVVEARLAADPDAQAELDALIEIDAIAQDAFDTQLDEPIPFTLAQQIKTTPLSQPRIPNRLVWGMIAASFVIFSLGGIGGYALKQPTQIVAKTGWLAAVADYHAVYANQERHLVEVGADQSDHITKWLGDTVGVNFTIPDLSSSGLIFEGGRLLVANGKPVAQLMYRQTDGTVIALCLQKSGKSADTVPVLNQQTIKGFDFVSWTDNGADYVVIGPEGQPKLRTIATQAAASV